MTSEMSLEDFEAHFETMKKIDAGVARENLHGRRLSIMDSTNPGSSGAHSQGRPGLSVDQTTSSSISSASVNNSDGQEQVLDLNPGSRGVTVTEIPRLSTNKASDGQFQRKDLDHLDQGTSVTEGPRGNTSLKSPLPTTVMIDSQNLHRAPLATADVSPIAIDIDAGRRRLGGLAESINIK